MSASTNIREAIRRMSGDSQVVCQIGTVKAVDEPAQTCEVEVQGLSYYDVRLRALPSGDKFGLIILPAVHSTVLVAEIEGVDEMRYVAQYSEIDQAYLILDGVKVQVDSDAVKITNDQTVVQVESGKVSIEAGGKVEVAQAGLTLAANGQNLQGILLTLVQALETLTVTCSVPGVPSTPPINVAAFSALRPRIQSLLNG